MDPISLLFFTPSFIKAVSMMMKLLVVCGLLAAIAASRQPSWLREAEPFSSGKEFVYRYRSQVASGLGSIDQHAAHLITAEVHVNFETDRVATLWFSDVFMGVRNDLISEPRRIQESSTFDGKTIAADTLNELEMPLRFELHEGLVENINFADKDSDWSKNVKRSVLNLIQLNMSRRDANVQGAENDRDTSGEDDKSLSNMFVLTEKMIEGECQAIYTILPRESSSDMLKVSKSINFKNCPKLAFLRYGPQAEKQSYKSPESELDWQQLERSTVIDYQLSGTPESYGIARVEAVSQLVYKLLNAEDQQPMHTIITAEMILQSQNSESPKEVTVSDKDETIIYSMERENLKRRYYQYGDVEFPGKQSPFHRVENKAQAIAKLLKEISEMSYDFTNGISVHAPLKVQELVELVRMCSVEELEKVPSKLEKSEISIFTDALAIAGTRNSVNYLITGILNRDITTSKAVQTLRQLTGLYAVSSKHVEELQRLCKSSVAKDSEALRQSCWLTYGSIVSQVCRQTSNTQKDEDLCPRHVKDQVIRTLTEEYQASETIYQKAMILKAIGNAGCDKSIHDLEKIIDDKSEEIIVRQTAIDSLRRLRYIIPIKIQRVLMPLFQNTQERPEIRMSAFSMIMYTIPEKAILDQVTYTLHHERNQDVRSFVYTTIRAYSQSPVTVEKELAHHLRAVLKMLPNQELRWSRFHRYPIWSQEYREGLLINIASSFAKSNILPQHWSMSVDTLLNGIMEQKNIELSMTNVEKLLTNLVDKVSSMSSQADRYSSSNSHEESRKLLDSIFNSLKIQTRGNKTPFGMMALRLRDIDYMILPLTEEMTRDWTLSNLLQPLRNFRYNTVASMHERTIKVATISGMPLRMTHFLNVVAGAEGEFHMQPDTKLQLRPLIRAAHVQKMEIWTPIVNTGAERLHTISLNLPMDLTYVTGNGKIIMIVPQDRTRLVSMRSSPITFHREFLYDTQLYAAARIRTIAAGPMDNLRVEIPEDEEKCLRFYGSYHRSPTSAYRSWFSVLAATENGMVLDFVPSSDTPKAFELVVRSEMFRDSTTEMRSSHRPSFQNFFESRSELENEDDDYDVESNNVRRTKLQKFSDNYRSNKVYDHEIQATLKSTGGSHEYLGDVKLGVSCDPRLTFCKTRTEIRSKYDGEDWNLKMNSQVLVPEKVMDVEKLAENGQDKFNADFLVEWGNDKKETIYFKILGSRFVSRQWINSKWQRNLATAFLNKYDIEADYDVSKITQRYINFMWRIVKTTFYWKMVDEKSIQGPKNKLFTTIVIDPITRRSLNWTVKTPTEMVKFTLDTPYDFKLFPLVQSQAISEEVHSSQGFFNKLRESRQAVCRVDGKKLRTFDSNIVKMPLGSCYTVLAKDCAQKTFVVMMKTNDDGEKKLKVITPQGTFEAYFKYESELAVRINGREISDVQELSDRGISFTSDLVTLTLPQVSVRFDGREASVKLSRHYQESTCGLCGHFDGEEDDEFRMADDSITDDLKAFHRSYSMLKEDDECKINDHERIYSDASLFEKADSSSSSSRRRYSDSDYDSGLEDEIQEYRHFDREQDDEEIEDRQPIKITKIIEHKHKICLSLRAVEDCPRGTYPESTRSTKVQFICLDRSSPKTRRLLRLAHTEDVSDQLENKVSIVETVRAAVRCN